MRERYPLVVFSFLALVGFLSWDSLSHAKKGVEKSTQSPQTMQNAKVSAKVREKMWSLNDTLFKLIVDMSSNERFNDPKNRSRIESYAKKLYSSAHDLHKTMISSDLDPSIRMFSEFFQEEAKRGYLALTSGSRTYGRQILGHISSVCVECHTRSNSGPSFPSNAKLEPALKGLSTLDRGKFFAATRQYDHALELFEKVVDDSTSTSDRGIEWNQAARYGLAIAVRAKQDPDRTSSLIDKILQSKSSPQFLKENATAWKDSVKKWKEERVRSPKTEEGLYTEAKRLIALAYETQKYPQDHSADILYLRASALIHELLQSFPDGKYTQDALMMAGLSYEVLRSLSMNDLQDVYYEACIRKKPGTQTAQICYRRYEENTFAGFSGTGGTLLPPDVKNKLLSLEALSKVEPPVQKTEGLN